MGADACASEHSEYDRARDVEALHRRAPLEGLRRLTTNVESAKSASSTLPLPPCASARRIVQLPSAGHDGPESSSSSPLLVEPPLVLAPLVPPRALEPPVPPRALVPPEPLVPPRAPVPDTAPVPPVPLAPPVPAHVTVVEHWRFGQQYG
jgi:hypothetical protein